MYFAAEEPGVLEILFEGYPYLPVGGVRAKVGAVGGMGGCGAIGIHDAFGKAAGGIAVVGEAKAGSCYYEQGQKKG